MVKYYIYKLASLNPTVTEIYVGSTKCPKQRKHNHRISCDNKNQKAYDFKVYSYIRENGGMNNFELYVLEEFECANRNEARTKEHEYIVKLKATLNSRGAFEIPEERKEKTHIYKTQRHYPKYREEIIERSKQYYAENKERVLERSKHYREQNKEEIRERKKRYGEQNKEKIRAKKAEQVLCEACETMVNKSHRKRHERTKTHIEKMNESGHS